MNDVAIAVALTESLRIALPQQRRFALPIQRNSGIDATVNVKAMRVDMQQLQPIEPGDVGWRHGRGVATIGGERPIAALLYPHSHFPWAPHRLHRPPLLF